MNDPFRGVYKNCKVLVTGHTGFKGSWLTAWLTNLGADVVGYSLKPSTEPNMFETTGLEDRITHIIGDVRNEEHLRNVFKEHQPEIVFHLAAQPLVRLSYDEPKLTYETNIMGTVNLLESVKATKSVKSVVNITSDKCYDNKEWIYGYRENDPLGGYDPYSSSKACSELVTSAYINSYFNPKDYGNTHETVIATARAGNVMGGGDWSKDRIVTDCVNAINTGETIYIRNPKAIRPWQHVLEPLSGYLLLGLMLYSEGIEYSGAWNFGPKEGDVNSVETVVKEIIGLWGKGDYMIDKGSQPHEAGLLKLDTSKSNHYLKWNSVYNFKDALKMTIEWYKKFYSDDTDMFSYTTHQINYYTETAKNNGSKWAN